MKMRVLKCPECRANLEIKEDRKFCFCEYCGCKIIFDDEKQEININKNINITKNINNTKRYINDAEVLKERNKDKEHKRDWIMVFFCFALLLGIAVVPLVIMNLNETVAKNEGKVCAGFYRDLVGEDYKTVEAHFEAAGFTNIELIDLDDSGMAFWKDGKVETISVGGDTSFDTTDWFEPDTTVVISYH